MKKISIVIIAIIIAGLLVSSINYTSHSPGGGTGSPLDGSSCTSCHTGAAVIDELGWINSNIPVSGYIPGETYTITTSITHIGAIKVGFELTSENTSSKTGTFVITNSTETQLTGSTQAVTQTSSGVTPQSGTKQWTMDWVAPSAGTGDLSFFAALLAGNGGSSSGDQTYTSSLAIQEDLSASIQEPISKNTISIFPNPATELININTDYKQAVIYSIEGKLIGNYFSQKEITIASLKNGIYFIRIDNSSPIRFIKN